MPITETYISVCQGKKGADLFAAKQSLADAGVKHHFLVDCEVLTDPGGRGTGLPWEPQEGTPKTAFDGFVALWPDATAFDAFLKDHSILHSTLELVRCFNVVQPMTNGIFELCGKRELSGAKGVLIVNGAINEDIENNAFWAKICHEERINHSYEWAASINQNHGLIGTFCLNGDCDGSMLTQRNKRLMGGVYLFEDSAAIDAFIASDLWKHCVENTPWTTISLEKFNIQQ